jgi:hypothetical protein
MEVPVAKRATITIDKVATALRIIAGGSNVMPASKEAGLAYQTLRAHRAKIGDQHWEQIIAELRSLVADGWSNRRVEDRARQLLLGRQLSREVVADQEEPLSWAALAAAGQSLFAGKASNARGATRERFERIASDAWWREIRTKVAALLQTEQLDDVPPAKLLRAAWIAMRDIEGVTP